MTTIRGRLGFVSDRLINEERVSSIQGDVGIESLKDQVSRWIANAEQDPALCQIGMDVLGPDGTSSTEGDKVRAARKFFSSCNPDELRIGHIPVLMADYRRLARGGWAVALANDGPEALTQPDFAFPGRFMHFTAQDVRLKDIGPILTDYKSLVQMNTSS